MNKNTGISFKLLRLQTLLRLNPPPLIQEEEFKPLHSNLYQKYYCPLNMIIFSQLLEKEELRELLFWTSPLYEFNVSSGGGSAASISISLRSSSGLLKNVCILR